MKTEQKLEADYWEAETTEARMTEDAWAEMADFLMYLKDKAARREAREGAAARRPAVRKRASTNGWRRRAESVRIRPSARSGPTS